ncbi:MAG: hypothetical protein IT581_16035 [Verrucomicrobiales bacterium]|nr:hypothetical protein [Verrucomicrobiales bacterium]
MGTSSSASANAAVGPSDQPCLIGKACYGLMWLGILALAVSGIGTFVLGRAPMSHWILMAHVGASPMFAIGIAGVALLWPAPDSSKGWVSAALYWLLLLAGLVVILSGVLPMTPIFGTHGQHFLYLVHRYSGIVVAVVAVLHALSRR